MKESIEKNDLLQLLLERALRPTWSKQSGMNGLAQDFCAWWPGLYFPFNWGFDVNAITHKYYLHSR
jgi:hypothetical protein